MDEVGWGVDHLRAPSEVLLIPGFEYNIIQHIAQRIKGLCLVWPFGTVGNPAIGKISRDWRLDSTYGDGLYRIEQLSDAFRVNRLFTCA